MPILLKPEYLKRYKDIALLLVKYGRSDLVNHAGLDEALKEKGLTNDDADLSSRGHNLADDLEKLGPTFIKVGQLLSGRPDILPSAYIEPLSRLQDKVEPFSYDDVERIVESELSVRISKAFHDFDPEPIAAASLGQVHRATMRDGRPVAVKVQRPDIREQVAKDLAAMKEMVALIDHHTEVGKHYRFETMLDEFRKSLFRELDYRREAQFSTLQGRRHGTRFQAV